MRPLHRAIGATLLAGGALSVWVALSPNAVLDQAQRLLFSPWFPAVLVGLYLVRPFLAWPITALSVVVGYRYGIVVGLPLALLGAAGTSLIPYVAARYLRPEAGLLGRVTGGTERFFSATGHLRGVIAARLAPTPAEVISAAAGMARVSVPAFVVGTIVGELPWTIAAVVLGSSMHRLSLNASVIDPNLVIVGIVGALLVLAGPAYRYARGRTERIN